MTHSINEIMSKNVITISSEQTIQETALLMKQHNIGAIPIVDNGKLKGIVTDRDITVRSTAEGINPNAPVSQCMTKSITVADSGMDVHEVARIMSLQEIRRVPVVEKDKLIGIVALGDLAEVNIYQDEAEETLASISTPAHPENINP
jgi:CBS domain-containing protein